MPGERPGATVQAMQSPCDASLRSWADLAPTLRRVAEALDWPLVLVDVQGRLQHANRPAVRLMADGQTAAWHWPGRPGGQVGRLRPLPLPAAAAAAAAGLPGAPQGPALLLLDLRPAAPVGETPAPPPFGK
jgi:hypothetical protein